MSKRHKKAQQAACGQRVSAASVKKNLLPSLGSKVPVPQPKSGGSRFRFQRSPEPVRGRYISYRFQVLVPHSI